jgi:hypothetical protein
MLIAATDLRRGSRTLHRDQALVNIASARLQTDALSGARGSQQLYLHQCDYESLSKQEI